MQRVDPSFTLFDIALQRLGFRKLHLLVLHQFVVFGVQLSQFRLKFGPRGCVLLNADLILQRDDCRIHAANLGPHAFQLGHDHLALIQRAGQVRLNTRLLLIQHIELTLQQLHDHV